MMASGAQIIAHLLNRDEALRAVVPVSKQFLDDADQGVKPPYLVISDVGGTDGVHLLGQDQYPRDRIQIDCIDTTSSGARNICGLVNAALIDKIKMTINQPQPSGLKVKDVDILEAGRPQSLFADSRQFKIISQDYHVRWRRI